MNKGSVASFFWVGVIFAAGSVYARSGLLASLSVFAFASCFGSRTGYWHAAYFLSIKEPATTVVVFTFAAIGLYQLSLKLKPEFERLAIIGSRTAVFVINFGLWIGSLWGDYVQIGELKFTIDENVFAVAWAGALIAAGIWAWKRNRRALFNICAVFFAINFYTQYFEYFRKAPAAILMAGLIAIGIALGLKELNNKLKAGD